MAMRERCHPRDAEVILGIKLSARVTEDFLAWHGESNGLLKCPLCVPRWNGNKTAIE
jgi:hypothetical protein